MDPGLIFGHSIYTSLGQRTFKSVEEYLSNLSLPVTSTSSVSGWLSQGLERRWCLYNGQLCCCLLYCLWLKGGGHTSFHSWSGVGTQAKGSQAVGWPMAYKMT